SVHGQMELSQCRLELDMFTQIFGGLILSLGLLSTGLSLGNQQPADCCASLMACCSQGKACCLATGKMECRDNPAGCCSAAQNCCAAGAACCQQALPCCGQTVKTVAACCAAGNPSK